MSTIHESGPAFPIVDNNQVYELGISKRDWFASTVLAAIIQTDGIQFALKMKEHAAFAYAQADAMLAARQKGGDA